MLSLVWSVGSFYAKNLTLRSKIKKGSDNVIADYPSHIPNAPFSLSIKENFLDEKLLSVSVDPWYADIVNYLVTKETPSFWSKQDKYKFLSQVKYFYWDDPYLFKYYSDQIIRCCTSNCEIKSVLSFCHDQACGGHFGPKKTYERILQCGFYWPTLFKNSFEFVILAIAAKT